MSRCRSGGAIPAPGDRVASDFGRLAEHHLGARDALSARLSTAISPRSSFFLITF